MKTNKLNTWKKHLLLAICALYFFMFIACATPPNKIIPRTYVTPIDSVNCDALERKLTLVETKEANLYKSQRKLYSSDRNYVGLAIGLGVLIWPFAFLAFGVKGDDRTTEEYSEVIGEKTALENEIARRCS